MHPFVRIPRALHFDKTFTARAIHLYGTCYDIAWRKGANASSSALSTFSKTNEELATIENTSPGKVSTDLNDLATAGWIHLQPGGAHRIITVNLAPASTQPPPPAPTVLNHYELPKFLTLAQVQELTEKLYQELLIGTPQQKAPRK